MHAEQTAFNQRREAKPLLALLAALHTAIDADKTVTFTYQSLADHQQGKQPNVRHGKPSRIFFNDHYFYVAMYDFTREKYLTLRLDRFGDIKQTRKKSSENPPPFDLLEYRQKTYKLQEDELGSFEFRYTGAAETALDNFPSAKVKSRDESGCLIQVPMLYLAGAKIWLLSQGAKVTVTAPPLFAAEIHQEIQDMLANYAAQPDQPSLPPHQ